jgi:hypothetical protein
MSNMFLNIVSTFKGDGISSATRQLGAFGSATSGFGSTLGKVGAALASFGLAAKAVEFTKTSIDSARDLERNMYSLNTIFGDMAPQMESFAKGAHQIGLSQKDAAKASVFLGSVLKQSGFSMEDVTEQSQKLVSLGVDLAATYGYDVQEALLGMTALFRGEYDPIEKFGVAMKQSEINAELAARQLDHLTGSELRNAEQVIRMELLYQRAADATGAFTGQSGNLFVEQKKLQAQFENMQATVGQQLLPVMGSLVEALVPLVDELTPRLTQMVRDSLPALQSFTDLIKDMSDDTTNTGATVKFLADSFGQLFGLIAQNFGVLVQLAILFGTVTTAVTVLNAVMALTPLGQFAVAAGLAAGSVLLIYDAITKAPENFAAFREQLDGATIQMQDWQKSAFGFSNSILTIQSSFMPIVGVLKDISNNALIALGLLAEVQKVSKPNTKALMEMDRRHAGAPGVFKTSSFTGSNIAGLSTSAGGGKSKAQQAAEEAQRKEQELLDKRQKAFESFNSAVKSLFGQIKDSIMDSFTLPDLGNSVNSITKNISKLLERTKVFAKNIQTLSEQGLNATLLQQVIGAGPVQGAKLAQALVGGGSGFLQELNSAFGEFGNLAGSIAGIGTERAFANQQTVNNYSIEVTGGIATSSDVGRAVVNAIKDFERQSGTAWRG